MIKLYPDAANPPQIKSVVTLKREELQSAKEMFSRPPAPPSPAPAPEPVIGGHVFHPTEAQIASACSCNGNDRTKAAQSYVESGRGTLRRLRTLLPATAQTITADLQRAEGIRLGALAALATSTERLNELKAALLERTDLRQRIAGMKADLENATEKLASRESLQLDGPTLALLGQKERHLPAEISDVTGTLPALTERIERLAREMGVELPVVLAGLYAEANVRCGSSWSDPNFKKLHESGILWP